MNWIHYIKTDSNEALKEVYAHHKDKCVAWLNKNTNYPEEENLEIFQTAVVILYDNVMTEKLISLESNISTYLIAICKNKSRELQRARKKYSNLSEFPLLVDHCYQQIEIKKEQEIQLSTVTKMLNRMGDPCKSLLKLFYYQKMSLTEIGSLMGYRNAATTKNQKYKCMKRLQKLCLDIKV